MSAVRSDSSVQTCRPFPPLSFCLVRCLVVPGRLLLSCPRSAGSCHICWVLLRMLHTFRNLPWLLRGRCLLGGCVSLMLAKQLTPFAAALLPSSWQGGITTGRGYAEQMTSVAPVSLPRAPLELKPSRKGMCPSIDTHRVGT